MDICGVLSKKFSASDFFFDDPIPECFFDVLARYFCKPGLECPPQSPLTLNVVYVVMTT